MPEIKPKPCPFCNSRPHVDPIASNWWEIIHDKNCYVYVFFGREATQFHKKERHDIERWNRRGEKSEQLKAENERLKAELKHLKWLDDTKQNADRNLRGVLWGICIHAREEKQKDILCGNCQSILNSFADLRFQLETAKTELTQKKDMIFTRDETIAELRRQLANDPDCTCDIADGCIVHKEDE